MVKIREGFESPSDREGHFLKEVLPCKGSRSMSIPVKPIRK